MVYKKITSRYYACILIFLGFHYQLHSSYYNTIHDIGNDKHNNNMIVCNDKFIIQSIIQHQNVPISDLLQNLREELLEQNSLDVFSRDSINYIFES